MADDSNTGGDNEQVAHIHELEQKRHPPVKLTKKSRENADMKDMINTLLTEDEGDEVDLAFHAMAKRMKKQLKDVDIDEWMMETQDVVNRYIRASHRQNQPTCTTTEAGQHHVQHVSIPPLQPMPQVVQRDEPFYRDDTNTYYNM